MRIQLDIGPILIASIQVLSALNSLPSYLRKENCKLIPMVICLVKLAPAGLMELAGFILVVGYLGMHTLNQN